MYVIVHIEPLKRLAALGGWPKQAANPYYHAVTTLISGVARAQMQQGITDEKIDWIFDERLMEQGNLLSVWEALVHDAPDDVKPMIGSTPVFRKDDQVLPLQAADLEAWWMRRRAMEKLKGLPRLEYPWMPTNMPIAGAELDEEELKKGFARMEQLRNDLAILGLD